MSYLKIDEEHCLNYNYKKTECHSCRDICPQDCWDEVGNIVTERCDECGLCLSACPVDAIGVEGFSLSAWKAASTPTDGTLQLSCRRYGNGPWSCLGFLNARDLVALSWPVISHGRDVCLYMERCQECRPAVAAKLTQEMTRANHFLSVVGSGKILLDEKQPAPKDETVAMNRRSFFSSLFSTGIETARNVMWPEVDTAPLPKARWRSETMADRGGVDLTPMQDVFATLAVAPDCNACGLCAKICPMKALTVVERETGIELWHEPLLCSGCGVCVAQCPVSCISTPADGSAGKQLLRIAAFPLCNECGRSFQPAGQQLTCFDCLLKGRQSIFEP